MPAMHSPDPAAGLREVEAARYALLRRLSLAMREHMLAQLHPIGVTTHVLQRRLQEDAPDLRQVGADLGRVRGFARGAVETNLDVVQWLAPDPERRIALDAGIAECLALLRGHFTLRGFPLRQAEGGSGPPVLQAALRTALAAVLFGLLDEASAPTAVSIASMGATVQVAVHPGPGSGVAAPLDYRPLTWDEVGVLARAEGVGLSRAPGEARLAFG